MITLPFPRILRRPSVLLALAILLCAGALKWQSTWLPGVTTIPALAPVSPNARDFYTAAGRLIQDQDMLDTVTVGVDWRPPQKVSDIPMAVCEKFVADNQPALAKLHAGMALPYQTPPARGLRPSWAYLTGDRKMEWLLRIEGEIAQRKGDWAGAVRTTLDGIKLGTDLQRGAPIGGMLAAIGWQRIVMRPTLPFTEHLTADQARAAARRLAAINADPVSLFQMLSEEKWMMQSAILAAAQGRHWPASLLASDALTLSSPTLTLNFKTASAAGIAGLSRLFLLKLESPRTVYAHYTTAMDQAMANAQRPWPQRRGREQTRSQDSITDFLLAPVSYDVSLQQAQLLANDRLWEVQLALRAYRLDHGRYPVDLPSLIPAYIPTVPDDPFSDRQPLRYQRRGNRYVLYSLGPDAVDNGGTPIVVPATSYKFGPDVAFYRYRTSMATTDTRGDIVAGVNY